MQLVTKNQNQKKNASRFIQERKTEPRKRDKERRVDRRQAKEAVVVEGIMCKKAQTRLTKKTIRKLPEVAKILKIG